MGKQPETPPPLEDRGRDAELLEDDGLDPRDVRLREIGMRFSYLERRSNVAAARVLAAHDLTPPMYQVLFRLAYEGRTPQSDLILDAALDAAGVSRLLTRLGRLGLVQTLVDPDDRRRKLVDVTDAGRALERRLAPEVFAAMRGAVTGLTDEEEVQLLRLLDKAAVATAQASGDPWPGSSPPEE